MAKKDKTREAAPGTSTTPLRHSPFAALAGAPVTVKEAATPPQDEASLSPPSQPEPHTPASSQKSRRRLVLRRETKHRGGKAVIVVSGFGQLRDFDEAATEALAKRLKQKLGCGGTVEGQGEKREIVLQGDRPAKVAELLRAEGFRVDGVTG